MTTSIDKLYDIILSEMTPQPSKQRVGKLTNWGAKPTDGDGNGKTIEATNDDCSKCGIILTDDDMDRETGKCECCDEEHICGETGREFDQEMDPLKGCGETIEFDDENVMIGNISYCLSCSEKKETPLMVWDGKMKESIVEVECRGCKTIYKNTQSWNDCVSAYPYEYPKKGFYWRENKECYKCYKQKL